MIDEKFISSGTLCWDCANSTGNCSWSARLVPVKGWKAIETKKNTALSSFVVLECPKFERDSYSNGTIRLKKDEKNAQKR